MSKITVADALKQITAKEENGELKLNQFSKKKFENWLTACVNDTDFTSDIVKSSKGEIVSREASPVTVAFRQWLQKVLEEAGVDTAESARVLTPEFELPPVKGLYDFFIAAMYDYMKAGNYFQFPEKEDFDGKKLYLKKVPKSKTTSTSKNPRTGDILGTFEITKDDHYTLGVKGSCPKWLINRKKID